MSFPIWLSKSDETANTVQLGAFAVHLWRFGMNKRQLGNQYGTIVSKLCAVRWYHRSNQGFEPGTDARHVLLLKGIRRFTNPVIKQQPLTTRHLLAIHSFCDLTNPRDQLIWGGLLIAYFFLLRRSEYLFIGRRVHVYVLKLEDILLVKDNRSVPKSRRANVVGIRLRGAKNNQYGREEVRYQHRSGDPILCPVRGARWVLKAANTFGTNPEDPALSLAGGRGITSHAIAKIIKCAARKCDEDPRRFSTHSVRIGGATTLLNAGADRLVIKLLGRWLSNCFEDYPVLTANGTRGISKLMCARE